MDKCRILFAEEDKSCSFYIKQFLENKNFIVNTCQDGEQAIKLSRTENFDLAIIDLFLPKFNGLTVLRRIKDKKEDCPVIVITQGYSEINEIETYKNGANIIHAKPINYNVLEAQVNSLIKNKEESCVIEVGDIYLNSKLRLCLKDKREVYLTFNEFNLTHLLFSHRGKVFSREEIISRLLKEDATYGAVDTLISRIRSKLGSNKGKDVIETVVKSGFRVSLDY